MKFPGRIGTALLVCLAPMTLVAAPRILLTRAEPLASLALCDRRTDGSATLFVAGEREIWWYAYGNGAATESGRYQAARNDTILHLDCADLDGDRRDEVLVSARAAETVASFVLRAADTGRWLPSARRYGWYFRALQGTLLGQRGGEGRVFAGPVRELRWNGADFVAGEGLSLPRGTTLYGYGPLPTHDTNGPVPIFTIRPDGQFVRWERVGDRWHVTERLPRSLAALRGLCLPPSVSPFAPRDLETAHCLPLPPVSMGGGEAVFAAQSIALGGVVGRVPYGKDWTMVVGRAASENGSGSEVRGPGYEVDLATRTSHLGPKDWEWDATGRREHGTVFDLVPDAGNAVLVLVQQGRDDPFSASVRSQVIVWTME